MLLGAGLRCNVALRPRQPRPLERIRLASTNSASASTPGATPRKIGPRLTPDEDLKTDPNRVPLVRGTAFRWRLMWFGLMAQIAGTIVGSPILLLQGTPNIPDAVSFCLGTSESAAFLFSGDHRCYFVFS